MESKIKCIAVDDEPMALEVLDEYIQKVPYLEKAGLFNDALQALDYLRKHEIDLIFLDIQMPDLTGIQFLEMLEEKKLTILTTAYSDYALQSYDFDAVDYLLKPIAFDRFLKAAQKALKLWSAKTNFSLQPEEEIDQLIQIKSGHALHCVHTEDLFFVEGNGNYLNFHLKGKKILSLMKMDEALQLLPNHFRRIHKSFIINLNHITIKSSNQVTVAGQKLPISKTYKINISL